MCSTTVQMLTKEAPLPMLVVKAGGYGNAWNGFRACYLSRRRTGV